MGLPIKRVIVMSCLVGVAALVAASPAMATRGQDFVTCDNGSSYAITVTQQPSDNSVGWGVGTIAGGDHLIPTSFTGSLIDTTIGKTLESFTQAKGNGQGQHNQTQLTCQGPTETATIADLLQGDPLPPEWADMGAALTDQVMFTFTVTAVQKP